VWRCRIICLVCLAYLCYCSLSGWTIILSRNGMRLYKPSQIISGDIFKNLNPGITRARTGRQALTLPFFTMIPFNISQTINELRWDKWKSNFIYVFVALKLRFQNPRGDWWPKSIIWGKIGRFKIVPIRMRSYSKN